MFLAQCTMLWVRFGENISARALLSRVSHTSMVLSRHRWVLNGCFAWFSRTAAVLAQRGGGLARVGTGPETGRDCRPVCLSLRGTGPKAWLSNSKAERTGTAPWTTL